MWTVGFGSLNREAAIRKMAEQDPITAVLQAATHFEWTLKRVIKKLGHSPTRSLGEQLEGVYSFKNDDSRQSYFRIWKFEIASHYKGAALGTVLGSYKTLKENALDVRGRIIHGNGSVSDKSARLAIDTFFAVSKKLGDFAKRNGFNVDERLSPRPAQQSTE